MHLDFCRFHWRQQCFPINADKWTMSKLFRSTEKCVCEFTSSSRIVRSCSSNACKSTSSCRCVCIWPPDCDLLFVDDENVSMKMDPLLLLAVCEPGGFGMITLCARACRYWLFSMSTAFFWTDWNAANAAVNSSTKRSFWILKWRSSLAVTKSLILLSVSFSNFCVYVRNWCLRNEWEELMPIIARDLWIIYLQLLFVIGWVLCRSYLTNHTLHSCDWKKMSISLISSDFKVIYLSLLTILEYFLYASRYHLR